MKKIKFGIRRELILTALLGVILSLIAFTTSRNGGDGVVRDVRIIIENNADNHVLEEQDVFRLMQLDRENLTGASLHTLNLRSLEQRIRSNRWVEDADVYSDLKGNLFVEVNLRRAIARFIMPDGSGAFIAADGTVMPVPQRFAVRTVLITGPRSSQLMKMENIMQDEYGMKLLNLLQTLHGDEFWRAQIAQLEILPGGKIIMHPQVGNQIIEFGQPELAEQKLKKLSIFFTRILPTRGWNRYHRVNVEYENQIVAE
ncbi:MAG: cell division protein FtsQ [Cyclobacteriaceae bacterium]|nr:cell division protein FtsQ [Cyclobacteriaceae bacterium]